MVVELLLPVLAWLPIQEEYILLYLIKRIENIFRGWEGVSLCELWNVFCSFLIIYTLKIMILMGATNSAKLVKLVN